jgi:hypothetical protein
MVLAVALLLAQVTPVPLALPAAIPSGFASVSSSAPTDDTKLPDPSSDTETNSPLTVDLAAAHSAKNASSSSAATVGASSNSAPIQTAQSVLSLSSIRIQPVEPVKEQPVIQAEPTPSRRTWLALSLVQHGAATFDAYSTRESISRGAVEMDPMMRPFAHSPGLYAAIQVGPFLLDFVSRKMQRSQNSFARRMWWLPQSMSTAGFLYSGAHNLNVKGHP